MTSSGHDSHRPPQTLTPASSGPAPQARTASHDNRAAWRLTGLAVLVHMMRSRRFYERVTFAAIVLTALSRFSQENRARTLARLTAWNKRQVQLLERKAERQARRLDRKLRAR
jgi:hypothetical protein